MECGCKIETNNFTLSLLGASCCINLPTKGRFVFKGKIGKTGNRPKFWVIFHCQQKPLQISQLPKGSENQSTRWNKCSKQRHLWTIKKHPVLRKSFPIPETPKHFINKNRYLVPFLFKLSLRFLNKLRPHLLTDIYHLYHQKKQQSPIMAVSWCVSTIPLQLARSSAHRLSVSLAISRRSSSKFRKRSPGLGGDFYERKKCRKNMRGCQIYSYRFENAVFYSPRINLPTRRLVKFNIFWAYGINSSTTALFLNDGG